MPSSNEIQLTEIPFAACIVSVEPQKMGMILHSNSPYAELNLTCSDLNELKPYLELSGRFDEVHFESNPANTYRITISDLPDLRKLVFIEDISLHAELQKKSIESHIEIRKTKTELESALSELKQTQALLFQNAKFSTIGQISAGIAHEINQPLQSIELQCALLERIFQSKPDGFENKTQERIQNIKNASNRIKSTIKTMRNLVNERKDEEVSIGIDQILNTFLDQIKDNIQKQNIQLEVEIDPALKGKHLRLQVNRFMQVLLNLYSNSRDALSKTHGIKRIKLTVVESNSHTIRFYFEDNGPGISDENIDHIFDPFFTTKPSGSDKTDAVIGIEDHQSGMGLGLAIVEKLTKSIHGSIQIDKTFKKGAKFIIDLPNLTLSNTGPASSPLERSSA